MSSIICPSCNSSISEAAIFCQQCGTKVRCKSCGKVIAKNAKFCSDCGTSVSNGVDSDEKNTFEYHRKKDEVFCKVSLTNEVGKDSIQGLIQGLTNPTGFKNNSVYKPLKGNSDNLNNNNDQDFEDVDEVEIDSHEETNVLEESNFPHINDVEMNVNCSEAEWLLIYAFYESDSAKKTFTKKAVFDRYMEKRKTESRVKNFASNWKSLFKNYFSTFNENEIKFKQEHLSFIKDLVLGKEKGNTRNISKKRKSSKTIGKDNEPEPNGSTKAHKPKVTKSSSIAYNLVPDLNLHPKKIESLADFFSRYKAKNTADTILLIVYYLQKKISEQNIGVDKIYTCYKELGIAVPIINKAFENIKRRNGYLNSSDLGNVTITLAGENHLEHKLEKNSLNDSK
jgi:hypothetical protein